MNGSDEWQKEDEQANDLQNDQSIKDVEKNPHIDGGVVIDVKKAREDHDKHRKYILGIATSGLFIALMIISAFISIPIGTIKITLQFLITNICCLILGKKWAQFPYCFIFCWDFSACRSFLTAADLRMCSSHRLDF